MSYPSKEFEARNTRPEDFPGIIALCREVYKSSPPWTERQLASHLNIFPQGQFVVVQKSTGRIVAMAATLIVFWDDYEMRGSWKDFTASGMFTNHDPANGRTLYAAEVMTSPAFRRRGLAGMLYRRRVQLAKALGLLRIRAGARLAGYYKHQNDLSPEQYVERVVQGKMSDPTLSFQLKFGYHVLSVVHGYLQDDPESLGYAAVIEWLNPDLATEHDWQNIDPRFRPPAPAPDPQLEDLPKFGKPESLAGPMGGDDTPPSSMG
jgi:GNAT superfamily N-acetyltransferase